MNATEPLLTPWDHVRMAVADLILDGIDPEAVYHLTCDAETPEQFCAGALALIELNDIVNDYYQRIPE